MSVTDFSFSRESRIYDKEGFSRVFAKAKRNRRLSDSFAVLTTPNGQARARLGIVVAKKNVRLAVQRNRIKRAIRESFRQQQQSVNGLDIVVVVKKNFSSMPNDFFARLKGGS